MLTHSNSLCTYMELSHPIMGLSFCHLTMLYNYHTHVHLNYSTVVEMNSSTQEDCLQALSLVNETLSVHVYH